MHTIFILGKVQRTASPLQRTIVGKRSQSKNIVPIRTISKQSFQSFKVFFKTLKLNIFRISPEASKDEVDISKQPRGKSAPSTLDKDPLENWSTKDIKSINNILDASDRE